MPGPYEIAQNRLFLLLFRAHFFNFQDKTLGLAHNVQNMLVNQENKLFPIYLLLKNVFFSKKMFFL